MSAGSKYEIPEEVNENLLITRGKDVEMQTFKTNLVPEEQAVMADKENKLVVILCVGTITGEKNVFVKDHFRRSPPKGSRLPTICMDIHLRKITSSLEREERPISVVNAIYPDHYEGGRGVILCVGTITGEKNVFVKDHFRRSPPKGSRLPTICMDIHLRKITSSLEREERPISVVNAIYPDHYEGGRGVILCVGTITGEKNVFVKDHFRRSPPKGSRLPTICMDIHLRKITSSLEREERPISVVNAIYPDHYEGFNFTSSQGALICIFWAPEQ